MFSGNFKRPSLGKISMMQNGREIELSNNCTELIIEDNYQSFADYQITKSIETTCEVQHFIGVDLSSQEDVTSITLTGKVYCGQVQARTHKKKRINKKWLKKYGLKDLYKTKTFESDSIIIEKNEYNDGYSVEMENCKEV